MNNKASESIWVAPSSIDDFLRCPRSYYLKNVYKDPKTRRKISIMQPALALGQAVHGVLEGLKHLPVAERFNHSLLDDYEIEWSRVSGKSGGFKEIQEEQDFKLRGQKMLQRVMDHPGVLLNKTVELKGKILEDLPSYYLSEEENIVLCGSIDWLEYLPETDTLHIVDFKTGKNEEKYGALQLPIYNLLVNNCQSRKVSQLSYWYLDKDDQITTLDLPDLEDSEKRILRIAQEIKRARLCNELTCPKDGCYACKPYEAVLKDQYEYVGLGVYGKDVYISKKEVILDGVEDLDLDIGF